MNILLVVNYDINATSFGGEQRVRLIYEALTQMGDVYVLEASNCEEKVNSRHWKFHLDRQRGLRRVVNGIWFRLVTAIYPEGKPKYYPFPLLPEIQHYFPDVHFDIVVTRHLEFANRMHPWRVAPLFVDLDDHPMEFFRTCIRPSISPWRRPLVTLMQKFFIWAGLRHATGIWVANPLHERLVSRYGRTAVLQNIPFSLPDLPPDSHREEYVLTVGRMCYQPNHRGVNRFIKEVWPQVHRAFPSMRYLVVGHGVPESLAEEWSHVPGVSVLGFVDDLKDLYAGALATVVPVYSGSGTCIKVLESLANSRICLSMEFGVRGIPDSDISSGSCGIFVYKDADDFVSLLGRVVHDANWRGTQEHSARSYVESHYSRKHFFKQVQSLICPGEGLQ